ncbi:MAG: hypothetical protein ACLSVD_07750 [Eggerthellaceae bacterium]
MALGDEATGENQPAAQTSSKTAPADLDRDTIGCSSARQTAAPPWGSVYLDSESVLFGDSCIALGRWMRARGIGLHEGKAASPSTISGACSCYSAGLRQPAGSGHPSWKST